MSPKEVAGGKPKAMTGGTAAPTDDGGGSWL
jgi:hypothetical protein